ncbi:uncharacterized protein J4E88_003896 [Alternaria novae-zelandiae]|uniref:uncharacterized protein n=1 Tax=Alternaria novae-zelandiae TaxID=430562 RepID=UPI0020C2CBEF|nr:uncharacterized protein J4E88_003896 [Alternaria novae-zelandiae]KAI4686059.1 hypothetical protein J4E88_003896 [Alternaria novae-zelandiae]
MSDEEEAPLPATIEINNNGVLIRNIEAMMKELGLPDPDHHAANVNADAEVVAARRLVAEMKELQELAEERLGLPDPDHNAANANADAEVVAARRSVAQAKELLRLADERFHRVHDISIALGQEKGRKIGALRTLMKKTKEAMKKTKEAMREEGWTDLGEASEEHGDSSDSS